MWDGKNPVISKMRSSSRWRKLSAAILRDVPVCQICGNHAAAEVHHIELANVENFYRRENLAALCAECHERIHAAMRRGIDVKIFFGDENGVLRRN